MNFNKSVRTKGFLAAFMFIIAVSLTICIVSSSEIDADRIQIGTSEIEEGQFGHMEMALYDPNDGDDVYQIEIKYTGTKQQAELNFCMVFVKEGSSTVVKSNLGNISVYNGDPSTICRSQIVNTYFTTGAYNIKIYLGSTESVLTDLRAECTLTVNTGGVEHTVTLDLDGGIAQKAGQQEDWNYDSQTGNYSKDFDYGTEWIDIISDFTTGNEITKTGYGQLTWSITEGTLVEDTTLEAVWTPNEYTIDLYENKSGTDPDKSTFTATYDSDELEDYTSPSREGYTFTGFYKESGCENLIIQIDGGVASYVNSSDYTTGGKWTHDGAVSLYAGWTVNKYSYTLTGADPDIQEGAGIDKTNKKIDYGTDVTVLSTGHTIYSIKVVNHSTSAIYYESTTTFTFTMPAFDVDISVVVNPDITVSAANPIYNGEAQDLLTVTGEDATGHGLTIKYGDTQESQTSTSIPQRTDADDYTVWYSWEQDDNGYYSAKAATSVAASITPKSLEGATLTLDLVSEADRTYKGSEFTPSVVKIEFGTTEVYQNPVTLTLTGIAGQSTEKIKDAGSYTLTYTGSNNFKDTVTVSFTVVKKTITPVISGTLTKEFDRSEEFSTSGLTASAETGITGETAVLEITAPTVSTSSADAGNYEVSVPVALTDADVNKNYQLSASSVTHSATITKPSIATVTLTGSSAEYDGTDQSITISAVKTASDLALTESEYEISMKRGSDPTTDVKNAGTITVIVTAKENSNFTGSAQTSFVINQKEAVLEWSGTELIYSGTFQKPVCTVSNKVAQDEVEVTVSGQQKDAREDPYTATAVSLNNGNYKLPSVKTQTFTISPLEAVLSWGTSEFVYDGESHAPTVTVDNLKEGDVCAVNVSGAQTDYSPNQYTATATGLTNSNYKLPTDVENGFSITKRPLSIAGVTATAREYDGTKTVALAGGELVNVAPTDTSAERLSFTLGSGTLADANAGTGKAVSTSIQITGTASGNYEFTQPDSITVDIGQREIEVTPAAKSKVYGEADPEFTYSCTGEVEGEIAAFTGSLSREAGEDAGTYQITKGTLALANGTGGFIAANYKLELSDSPVYLTITKAIPARDVDYTIVFTDREYNGADQTLVTAALTDEGVAKGLSLAYSADGVNYSTQVSTGKDVGDYNVFVKIVGNGDYLDVIEPGVVTISKAYKTLTFEDGKFTVSVAGKNISSGTKVEYNSEVTVTPLAGYMISAISLEPSVEIVDSGTSKKFDMPLADSTLSVTTAGNTHTVAYIGAVDHGTVSGEKTSAVTGETVNFTVEAVEGYVAVQYWYYTTSASDKTYLSSTGLEMPDADITIGATFELNAEYEFSVTISSQISNGTIVASHIKAKAGIEITVECTPDSGYVLKNVQYKVGTAAAVDITGGKFTMPSDSVTILGEFEKLYSIDEDLENQLDFMLSATEAKAGTEITITPGEVSEGYAILSVTVTDSTVTKVGDVYMFTMPSEDVKVKILLSATDYDLTAIRAAESPDGAIITFSKDPANAGDEVLISIAYLDGYEFKSITAVKKDTTTEVALTAVAEGSAYKLTMPANDVDVTYSVKAKTYTVTATINNSGTVSPASQQVSHGEDSDKITFAPAAGYHFVSYSINGGAAQDIDPTKTTFEYTFNKVTENMSISVATASNSHTVTLTASPASSASFTYSIGGGQAQTYTGPFQVTDGASLSVTVSPGSSYNFSKWENDSTSATRSADSVTSDLSWTATMTAKPSPGPSPGPTPTPTPSSETHANPDGSTTESTTKESKNYRTGETTTETTSTTTGTDGTKTESSEKTVTDKNGNSQTESTSTTTRPDGSTSTTESESDKTKNADGSTVEKTKSETNNSDGSKETSESTKVTDKDGNSNKTTTTTTTDPQGIVTTTTTEEKTVKNSDGSSTTTSESTSRSSDGTTSTTESKTETSKNGSSKTESKTETKDASGNTVITEKVSETGNGTGKTIVTTETETTKSSDSSSSTTTKVITADGKGESRTETETVYSDGKGNTVTTNTDTSSVKNKDGSTTVTVSETVKGSDGSETTTGSTSTTKTNKDGSVTIHTESETKSSEGTVTRQVTDITAAKDGTVTKDTDETVIYDDGTKVTSEINEVSKEDGSATISSESRTDKPDGSYSVSETETTVKVDGQGVKDIKTSVSTVNSDGTSSEAEYDIQVSQDSQGRTVTTTVGTEERSDGSGKTVESTVISKDGIDLSYEFTDVYDNTDSSKTTVVGSGTSERVDVTVTGTNDQDIANAIESLASVESKEVMIGMSAEDGLKLSGNAVEALADEGYGLWVQNNEMYLGIDSDVVRNIDAQGQDDIQLIIERATDENMRPAQIPVVGDLYAVNVKMLVNGVEVHQLNGTATIVIEPGYSAAYVYYVDDDGNVELLVSSYDPATGEVNFDVEHFSIYMVSAVPYEKPSDGIDAMILWIFLIIAVILIIIAAVAYYRRSHKA